MMAVNRFGISRTDLKVLMSQRKDDAAKALEKYEGVESIAEQLETNLKTGLNGAPQDLESRRSFYGINQLPQNPPRSFLALCLDAIQDPTLLILIGAAVLSIVLSLVEGRNVSCRVNQLLCVTCLHAYTRSMLIFIYDFHCFACVCVCVCVHTLRTLTF